MTQACDSAGGALRQEHPRAHFNNNNKTHSYRDWGDGHKSTARANQDSWESRKTPEVGGLSHRDARLLATTDSRAEKLLEGSQGRWALRSFSWYRFLPGRLGSMPGCGPGGSLPLKPYRLPAPWPAASPLLRARSHLASPHPVTRCSPDSPSEASRKHELELCPTASWPRMTVQCTISGQVCCLFFSCACAREVNIRCVPQLLPILYLEVGSLTQAGWLLGPWHSPASVHTTSSREPTFRVLRRLVSSLWLVDPTPRRPAPGRRAKRWSQTPLSWEEMKSKGAAGLEQCGLHFVPHRTLRP